MFKLVLTMIFAVAVSEGASSFNFPVYRTKLTRDEPGQLEISEAGVSYRSDNGKKSLSFAFADIREVDLSDPRRISIETFDVEKLRLGGRKTVIFRLRTGTYNEDLARFLSAHVKRPVVGAYELPNETPFQLQAYHRQPFSGAHGTLIIGAHAIRFVSAKRGHSRTWLYRDIQTIGTTNEFQFRVSTLAETFTFDLKDRLPEEAHRLAWYKVYRLDAGDKGPRYP